MSDPARMELAERSYKEVLEATYHQDNKVGRFFGGIAFLVAGVLAFANLDVLRVQYLIGGQELALPLLLTASFLVTITGSALLFLLATSAPLLYPSSNQLGPHDSRSHLFFLSIAREGQQEWIDSWEGVTPAVLRTEYQREAYNLAFRTRRKYVRTYQASVVLGYALMLFVLTLIVGLHATAEGGGTSRSVPFDGLLRFAVAAVLAVFPALTTLQSAISLRDASDRPLRGGRLVLLVIMLLVVHGTVSATAVYTSAGWSPYLLAATVALHFLAVFRATRRELMKARPSGLDARGERREAKFMKLKEQVARLRWVVGAFDLIVVLAGAVLLWCVGAPLPQVLLVLAAAMAAAPLVGGVVVVTRQTGDGSSAVTIPPSSAPQSSGAGGSRGPGQPGPPE